MRPVNWQGTPDYTPGSTLAALIKTSRTGLTEATNFMFRWYKDAEICFA